jgi:hypothetical protein
MLLPMTKRKNSSLSICRSVNCDPSIDNFEAITNLRQWPAKKTFRLDAAPSLVSARHFCDVARARFEHCATFDDKLQFLVEHVESIIYDRYRCSGSIKMQISQS